MCMYVFWIITKTTLGFEDDSLMKGFWKLRAQLISEVPSQVDIKQVSTS